MVIEMGNGRENNEIEIDLVEVLHILLERIWLILGMGLFLALVCFIFSKFLRPHLNQFLCNFSYGVKHSVSSFLDKTAAGFMSGGKDVFICRSVSASCGKLMKLNIVIKMVSSA